MNANFQKYHTLMTEKMGPMVHHIARKCGHNFDQITFDLCDSPHIEFSVNPATSAIRTTTGTLDTLQGANLSAISRETKAVLAHEIAGHVGHHTDLSRWAKTSVFAGPFIAIAAYELVHRYLPHNASDKEKKDAAKHIAESEPPDGQKHIHKAWHDAAKYVAIAALGLAAGGLIGRHISRRMEFEADRRAIEFTKDPEGLVLALQKLHAAADNLVGGASKEAKSISKWLQNWSEHFANATFMAHPSLTERVSYIRGLSPTISH